MGTAQNLQGRKSGCSGEDPNNARKENRGDHSLRDSFLWLKVTSTWFLNAYLLPLVVSSIVTCAPNVKGIFELFIYFTGFFCLGIETDHEFRPQKGHPQSDCSPRHPAPHVARLTRRSVQRSSRQVSPQSQCLFFDGQFGLGPNVHALLLACKFS